LLHFPLQFADIPTTNSDWRFEFIRTWKEEKENCWVEITNKKNSFANKNRTAIHGHGTWYFPMRAKTGVLDFISIVYVPGYRSGVHYWEVIPQKCEYRAHNTYIGVCTDQIDITYCLGRCKSKFHFSFFLSYLR
jgi:hypothetical protein